MLQLTIIIVWPYISLTFIFHIYYTVPQISESLLKIQWGFCRTRTVASVTSVTNKMFALMQVLKETK